MDAFTIPDLLEEQRRRAQLYYEFLRVPCMSAGLYVLAPSATDPQQPHSEDELYVVIQGQGYIQVAGESRTVTTGTLVFVPAGVPHHFHTISEELQVLVLFAPA